jgi:hypothetical protein
MPKWTEGEVRKCLEEKDRDVALEVLQYIVERGLRVVDWGNMDLGMYAELSSPEEEECPSEHRD